ncbi:hypothetical protein ACNVED_08410 [Legionella sp. D16C41]|uniref:hypothetical protein n=1 Tax=Legionella sp. D16C41 TaxID=3402688 RepID=UPI003AF817F4
MRQNLKEEMEADFLNFLKEILTNKEKLDIAVRDRKSVVLLHDKDKVGLGARKDPQFPTKLEREIGLLALDSAGIFNDKGEINSSRLKEAGIVINQSQNIETYKKNMSLRESLILDAAISSAHEKLVKKYKPYVENLKDLQDDNPQDNCAILVDFDNIIQSITKEVTRELLASSLKENKNHIMTSKTGYTVNPYILQRLNRGFYNFKNTNIIISPGPVVTTEEGEGNRKLSFFYNNLTKNKVKHVFSIGRVFPYYPRAGDKTREIISEVVMPEDFSNYFIPDVNGIVRLPSPAYDDFKVNSKVIEKVGRITTYEISINGGAPIQIHNLPLHDKQPLELTVSELAYVRQIQKITPSDQKILTHCRGGKGRSAQVAYILNSNPAQPVSEEDNNPKLKAMRLEKCGDQDSRHFVETRVQEEYLENLDEKTYDLELLKATRLSSNPRVFDIYLTLDLLFREEIKRVEEQINTLPYFKGLVTVDKLSPYQKEYIKLLELYHKLQETSDLKEMLKLFKRAQNLSYISSKFKNIFLDGLSSDSSRPLLKRQVVELLQESLNLNIAPVNKRTLYDIVARNFAYEEVKHFFSHTYQHNPVKNLQKNIDLKIATVHLAQGYLRQYKQYQTKMAMDPLFIAIDLQAGVARAYIELAKIKAEFDNVPSGSTLVSWKRYQDYVKALKEAVILHNNNIGELLAKDNEPLLKKINQLEHIFEVGIDKAVIKDKKISLALEDSWAWANEQVSSKFNHKQFFQYRSQVQKWRQAVKSNSTNLIVSEFRKKIIEDIKRASSEISNPAELIKVAQEALLNSLELIKDPHPAIQPYIKKLREVAKELDNVEADNVKIALSRVVTLVSKPFWNIQTQNELNLIEEQKIELNELLREIITEIDKAISNKKDSATLAQIARNTLLREINEVYNNNPLILANVDNLEALSETLKSFNEDDDKQTARYQILTLISSTFNPFITNITSYIQMQDQQEVFAKEALEVANKSALKKDELAEKTAKEQENLEDISTEMKYVKAKVASAKHSRIDLINNRLSLVDKKDAKANLNKTPTIPKMVIFDVDDTLVDLDKGSIKNKELLFNLLRKIKQSMPNTIVALCTNRTLTIDGDPLSNGGYPLNRLVAEIQTETGVVIEPEFQHLYTTDLQTSIQDIYQEIQVTDESKKEPIYRLIQGKNFQLDELRARYAERSPTKKLPLESECVFVDDSEDIHKNTIKSTNYLAVKATDNKDKSVKYLVELGYRMGVYSPLIHFLQDKTNFLRIDAIPNFEELGFKHSFIVKHITLKDFYKAVEKLPGNKDETLKEKRERLEEYKYDYTMAAFEHFEILGKELQDKVVKDAWHYIFNETEKIQTTLSQMVKENVTDKQQWEKLTKQVNGLITLEQQYAKKIGSSCLDIDLYYLQALIRTDIQSLVVIDKDGVNTVTLKDSKTNEQLLQSLVLNRVENKITHALLTDDENYLNQYTKYLGQLNELLGNRMVQIAKEYSTIGLVSDWSEINNKTYIQYNDYSKLLNEIKADIDNIDPWQWQTKVLNIRDRVNDLVRLKQILVDLKSLSQTAKLLDRENKVEEQSYDEILNLLIEKVDQHQAELKENKQYKAMIFLENAEKYIYSSDRNWKVGRQWTKYTLKDTDIAIPKHVAMQLAEIEAAKLDGDYVKHMQKFVEIGQKQAKSCFSFLSSNSSLKYSSIFSKNTNNQAEVIENLQAHFSPPNKA